MKETIDLLGKIITNILTALYEPFGFSLLLSFLAMFFYITFKKEEEINVIDISDCTEILSAMKDRIKNVEVYYNPYTTKLVSAIEEAKIYNIVTQKEV